jgi:hypothetical protein
VRGRREAVSNFVLRLLSTLDDNGAAIHIGEMAKNSKRGADHNRTKRQPGAPAGLRSLVRLSIDHEALAAQARSNTLANFRHVFDPRAMEAIIERMERNQDITEQFMANDELRGMMLNAMMREFYSRARTGSGQENTSASAS